MKTLRWLSVVLVLALTLALIGSVAAQSGVGPQSVVSLYVPSPLVQGQSVTISWDMDLNGTGPYKFRVYIPSDWYVDWASGTGVTVTGLGALTWGDSGASCSGLTINWVSTICNEWSANDPGTGETMESIGLTFNIKSDATVGTGRPVRVVNNGGSGGTPNIATTYVQVIAAPTTIYASDSLTCLGYGTPGISCFQSLSAAYNAVSGSNKVVIVGTLTQDGPYTINKANDLEGMATPVLAGSGACGNLLTINQAITVKDITITGAGCSSSTAGVVGGNGTLDNVTVKNFAVGVSTSGMSIFNSIVENNTGDGVVVTGGTPVIKNNRIRNNGGDGVELQAAASIYANRITTNGGQQVNCNGATTGAAWNYLGGTSPLAGSNCNDTSSQLGADWINWAESATSLDGASSTVAGLIFNLGDNAPFGLFGMTAQTGRSTPYYVFQNGTVTLPGTATQFKMNMPPDVACYDADPNNDYTCWESATKRAQTGPGYFYRGTADPTAVTLKGLSSTNRLSMPLVFLAVTLVLSAGVLVLRRRA